MQTSFKGSVVRGRRTAVAAAAAAVSVCGASASASYQLMDTFFDAPFDSAPLVVTSETVRVYDTALVGAFAELSVIGDGPDGPATVLVSDLLGPLSGYVWIHITSFSLRSEPGPRVLLHEEVIDFAALGAIATTGTFVRTNAVPHPPSGGVIGDGYFEAAFVASRFGSFEHNGESYETIGFVADGLLTGWAPSPGAAVLLAGAGLFSGVRRRR